MASVVRNAADTVTRAAEQAREAAQDTAHDAASAVREVRDDARAHSRVTQAVEETMTARARERDAPA